MFINFKQQSALCCKLSISNILYLSEIESIEDIEPKLMEPDKCEGWYWIDFDSGWDEMKPMFSPLRKLHEAYQTFKWNPFGTSNTINLYTE